MPYRLNAITGLLDLVSATGGAPLPVDEGGTGRATLTDGAVLVGNGTDPVTLVGPLTDGQLLIGDTAGIDPVAASLTAPAAGIDITSGAGSITFSLADDLAAVEGLAGTGLATRTAANTWTTRTITGATDGSISFTDGDGVSGNPTVALNDRVRNQGIYYENIGVSYASGTGTFTVHSADGTAFSTSNPGIVVLPSKATPGIFTTYQITANQYFIDDNGASEINGNLFAFTSGIAITVNVPFYIYAVSNDAEDTIQFMLSRYPHVNISSATIGTPSSAIADSEGSFFSFDNITTTEYDQNPCVCVGSINMQMSASDDWTVQTLSTQTGVGQFQENVFFSMPQGQFGANASTITKANGGTAPAFSTSNAQYTISKNGYIRYRVFLTGDGGTDGSGAVNAIITSPYQVQDIANFQTFGMGIYGIPGPTDAFVYPLGTGSNGLLLRRASAATPFVQWSEFTNGVRTITFNIYFHLTAA